MLDTLDGDGSHATSTNNAEREEVLDEEGGVGRMTSVS